LTQLEFFPYLRGDKQFGTDFVPWLEMKVDSVLYESFEQVFPSERGAGGIGSTGA
jgi:dUTPase